VPRELTSLFKDPCTLGYVGTCGRALGSGPYGASVMAVPALRSAHIDVLPPAVAHAADLSAVLPRALWEALEAETLAAADQMCQVTGLPADVIYATRPEVLKGPGGERLGECERCGQL